MKEHGYFRASLLVPPLAHLLLAASRTSWDGVMAVSLYFGALPYLLWGVVMFRMLGQGSPARVRRLVWLAPLTYLLVFAIVFPVIGVVTAPIEERAEAIPLGLAGVLVLTPFILVFGYVWVGVVSLGWMVARRYVGKGAPASLERPPRERSALGIAATGGLRGVASG